MREFHGNLGLNFDLCRESKALESGNTADKGLANHSSAVDVPAKATVQKLECLQLLSYQAILPSAHRLPLAVHLQLLVLLILLAARPPSLSSTRPFGCQPIVSLQYSSPSGTCPSPPSALSPYRPPSLSSTRPSHGSPTVPLQYSSDPIIHGRGDED